MSDNNANEQEEDDDLDIIKMVPDPEKMRSEYDWSNLFKNYLFKFGPLVIVAASGVFLGFEVLFFFLILFLIYYGLLDILIKFFEKRKQDKLVAELLTKKATKGEGLDESEIIDLSEEDFLDL